ncbi:hypothetical protein C0Q70_02398 [Pomacea canaliculata]|uniref:Uncharacterized protein n=1 Tax=Pomacea canaliculata TaxID=400727 RepID=A0A2T7PPT1_POMCA|nr:hypothetical protein C0Q70_02398 [Pomacea canaliculata]
MLGKLFLKRRKKIPLFRLDLGLCLLEAAKVGNDAAVISVLELSPSLRRTDAKRRQAIHYAAQNGLTQSVECLLRAGATVSCSDDCDWTPLHITCQHGYLEVARILLRQGANANSARTQDRITPLHIVSASGNLALVELLLNNRGNPNTKTSQEHGGFTALALAVKNGLLDVAIMLCEHGANIDEIDAEGRFLPHLALDSGQPAMLNFLCRQNI